MTRSKTVLAALLLAVPLAACRTATAPVAAPPTAAPVVAGERPGEITPDVHWVDRAAEYRAVVIQTYRLAEQRLEELAAGRQADTWAVALDADETVISNIEFEKELRLAGGDYQTASFGEWTARREATLLPGVMGFLDRVRELGGKIAIVTNRRQSMCADTDANLKALSIPYDVLLCRTDDREKEPRWEKVEDGTAAPGLPPLEILLWLGDNIGDFPGRDQERRHLGEEAYGRCGADFFVLPNPMYGSWELNPEE